MKKRRVVPLLAVSGLAGCAAGFLAQDFLSVSATLLGEDFSDIAELPESDPPNVVGTYDWVAEINGSAPSYIMTGTITLEQEDTLVRVVDTTHSNPLNRQLEGEARLSGNVLTIQMVPQNGDTDYTAEVTMTFSSDGDRFVVEFADTNEDFGPAHGSRRGPQK